MDDFNFRQHLREAESKEIDLFKSELIDISNQFIEIKKETFDKDEFKFAMVEVRNDKYEQQIEDDSNLTHKHPIKKTLIISLIKHTYNDKLLEW